MFNLHKKNIIPVAVLVILLITAATCIPGSLQESFTPGTAGISDSGPVPVSEPPGVTPKIPSQLPEPPSAAPSFTPMPPAPSALPSPAPSPAPVPPARDLTDIINIVLPDNASASVLLDRDFNTKRNFGKDIRITVSADEEIHSLYIVWDKPPGIWSVVNNKDRSFDNYGFDDFIHEYAVINDPADEIEIILPPDGAVICDIYAFSYGVPPQWVQVWQPPLVKADLLVIPTHADDEHLFFVGVMPYYAGERGLDVQVAYLTNHWNDPPRPHEALNGLWTVGITDYPYFSHLRDIYTTSFEDAQAKYGYDNIVRFHVELLRRFKPSVVVGHDINGEYGHGAHMLNARALIDAVDKAADSAFDVSSFDLYGTWDTPKLYLHLYKENPITMDWDIPLDFFDGATARDMAIAGYDCHKSQHKWSFAVPSEWSGSTTGSVFGLVRSLVGPDITGGDMFENILT